MAVYTLEARLELAIEIAEEAGQMIRNARERQGFSQRLKGGIELVTDVDVAVDTLISRRLEEHFPEEARLSEELSRSMRCIPPPSSSGLWIRLMAPLILPRACAMWRYQSAGWSRG